VQMSSITKCAEEPQCGVILLRLFGVSRGI
jgi:hypothetical protein